MSATSYRCAYCGSTQTWAGTGARVCSQCGATQPERSDEVADAAPIRRRVWPWLLLIVVLLAAAGVGYFHHGKRGGSAIGLEGAPLVPTKSRLITVNKVEVREVPAGSNLTALDLLRSAPANAGTLFDTKALSFAQPRGMNSIEGTLYFVGEVTNHSPDSTAMVPAAELKLMKRGRVIETTDLNFSDLPPGGHTPAFFTWGGEPDDFDYVEIHWKPVQGYPAEAHGHPRLQTTITDRKTQPGTVTINFSRTFHFVTATVKGTVSNQGDAMATGVQLYLTLRDSLGRVTGFKEKDLGQLGPGQSIEYELDADQWGEPVASFTAEALNASEPVLK